MAVVGGGGAVVGCRAVGVVVGGGVVSIGVAVVGGGVLFVGGCSVSCFFGLVAVVFVLQTARACRSVVVG